MTRPTQDTAGGNMISRTGLSPSMVPPFQTDSTIALLSNSLRSPTTPVPKWVRFGLFRFRSPLLTESIFLSVPLGTEMFQFSKLATINLLIQFMSVRESPDQRLFNSSPKLIAVFHALQSLPTPRRPPCALLHLIALIYHSFVKRNHRSLFSLCLPKW